MGGAGGSKSGAVLASLLEYLTEVGAAGRFAATAALLFALAMASAHPARAADNWSALAGEWRLDPSRSDLPDTAIRSGVRGLFFAVKGIAKSKLHKHLDPSPTMRLHVSSDSLIFRWHKDRYYMLPGHPEFYYNNKDEGRVTSLDSWNEGALVNYRKGKNGSITRRFALSENGEELGLTLTIISEKLPRPVKVHYVYVPLRKT